MAPVNENGTKQIKMNGGGDVCNEGVVCVLHTLDLFLFKCGDR